MKVPEPAARDGLTDAELMSRVEQCRIWFARTRDTYADYRSAEMERQAQREHRVGKRALGHARRAPQGDDP